MGRPCVAACAAGSGRGAEGSPGEKLGQHGGAGDRAPETRSPETLTGMAQLCPSSASCALCTQTADPAPIPDTGWSRYVRVAQSLLLSLLWGVGAGWLR